jgi:hypothetical protein
VPLQTPLAKEGLAVLGRSELEAAILKLQEDHARRKEAFEQECVPRREERKNGEGGGDKEIYTESVCSENCLPLKHDSHRTHSFATASTRVSRPERHSKKTTRGSVRSVRYIELASNVGPLSQVQSRNVAALQEALVSERERANAAASALRLLDEELHNTSQELRYEDSRSLFLYIRSL